jgi:hypothetical protein
MPRPIVLVHGYSNEGKSFERCGSILAQKNLDPVPIHITNYVTLGNEVTIKDIAEAFDRALADVLPKSE